MTAADVRIRLATAADAGAISVVHVKSWRAAYAGIVPADYLANIDENEWKAVRLGKLDDPSLRTWVAEDGGTIRGFASLGPSRDEDAESGDLEIHSIYLEPEAWGVGIARDLMRTLLADVPPPARVTLWVLADAGRARHFYRRHGFSPDGVERSDIIGGKVLTEVRYRRG